MHTPTPHNRLSKKSTKITSQELLVPGKGMEIVVGSAFHGDQLLLSLEVLVQFLRVREGNQGIMTAMQKKDGTFYLIDLRKVVKPEAQIERWKKEG